MIEFLRPSFLSRCAVTALGLAPLLATHAEAPSDAAQASAAPLAFADFYKRPVGPRGLEPGARLLALAGTRVELAGYLVDAAETAGAPLIIAPVPVVLGDEDESFADDLPASNAYLHPVDERTAQTLRDCHGPVRVRGRLDLGRNAESDGRFSFVRVEADAALCVAPASR
jgi:hypothetical protein